MNTQSFTQKGYFSIAIFIPLIIFVGIQLNRHDFQINADSIGLYLVELLMVLCLLTFHQIKITVTDKNVSFKMGIGLIKKTYALQDITKCKPVRNSAWSGIGIRLIPNGWLFNVSGLEAIELSFKSRSSITRIGTNKAAEVANLINEKRRAIN